MMMQTKKPAANPLMEIAERIREMREIVGYSEAEMAEKTEVSVEQYHSYEQGTVDFPFTFMHKCALAFGVELTDLLEGQSAKLSSYTVTRRGMGPVTASEDGITILPVSKVSFGFASAGTDFDGKNAANKDLFGGGAGAGVSIQPVAFLVVQEDSVRLLQMDESDDLLGSAIRSVPGVVEQIGGIFKRGSKKPAETAAETAAAEEKKD